MLVIRNQFSTTSEVNMEVIKSIFIYSLGTFCYSNYKGRKGGSTIRNVSENIAGWFRAMVIYIIVDRY